MAKEPTPPPSRQDPGTRTALGGVTRKPGTAVRPPPPPPKRK